MATERRVDFIGSGEVWVGLAGVRSQKLKMTSAFTVTEAFSPVSEKFVRASRTENLDAGTKAPTE